MGSHSFTCVIDPLVTAVYDYVYAADSYSQRCNVSPIAGLMTPISLAFPDRSTDVVPFMFSFTDVDQV